MLELDSLTITKETRTIQPHVGAHDCSRVMLSRCHSHRIFFCVDTGSGIGKKIKKMGIKHLLITRAPCF